MADENSIKRYQDTLKAYRESQGVLDDMGLPETTEDPVQDMIDQANEAARLEDARRAELLLAKKTAGNDRLDLELDNDPISGKNMDEAKKALLNDNIAKSQASGSIGKEGLDNLKELTSMATAPEKPVTPPVSGEPTDKTQRSTADRQALLDQIKALREGQAKTEDSGTEEPVLSKLEQAKKDRAMQEAFADISEGISKFGAGYAGGGLTQLKADTSAADLMRKRAQRGYTETEKEVSEAKAEEKAAIEADAESERKSKIDKLNTRYKNAQIANMLKKDEAAGGLSVDPNSDESKATAKRYTKMYPGLDFTDLSAKDIVDNVKNRISNRRIEEYYVPKTEQGSVRITNSENEKARKWFNDNQEDLKKNIKEFTKNPVVISARKMSGDAISARNMANSKNPLANAAIPTFVSRASGEVGALSEGDKKPFGGSKAIISRLAQIKEDMVTGRLTDENAKYVADLADLFDKTSNQKLENEAEVMSSQYGGIDFPKKLLKDRFLGKQGADGIGFEFDESDPSSTFKEKADKKDPKIEQYAKQNNLDYTKAEQLLRSRGYGTK